MVCAISFKSEAIRTNRPYLFQQQFTSILNSFGGTRWKTFYKDNMTTNNDEDIASVDRLYEMTGYDMDILDTYYSELKNLLEKSPRIFVEEVIHHRKSRSIQEINYNFDFGRNAEKDSPLFLYAVDFAVKKYKVLGIQDQEMIPVLVVSTEYPEELWRFLNTQDSDYLSFKPYELLKEIPKEDSRIVRKRDHQFVKLINIKHLGSLSSGNSFIDSAIKDFNSKVPFGFKIKAINKTNSGALNYRSLAALAILIYLIFTICGVLFNSAKLPLLIIGVLLCSLSGIILLLYWFNLEFNEGTLVSVFMCSGLVVNSSIYILSDYRNSITGNTHDNKAEILAISIIRKARPVLITHLSTILGLLPFIFLEEKNSFWFAMAAGTTGGLIISLPLVFILISLAPGKILNVD